MRLELQVVLLSSLLGIPLGLALSAYLRERLRGGEAVGRAQEGQQPAPHARQT